jgi:hypothetical protein
MKKTLMEAYAKRLNFAESLYKEERGCAMPQAKKSIIAQILNNTNRVLTEAFAATAATQTANVGGVNAPTDQMKKFCLDVANIALPNLIAMDLVLTKPMTSEYGTVRYLKFVAGVAKGGVSAGQPFNTAFKLGTMDESRVNYTGADIVETVTGSETNVSALAFGDKLIAGSLYANNGTSGAWQAVTVGTDGAITITGATKVKYQYDNVVIPQGTIPTIKAEFDTINLQAKARRIAIYYSTLAQYTYKVESGEDLGAKLKEQAMSEIQYEIDNEVTYLLKELAFNAEGHNPIVTFYKKKPIGISLREHYMSILATFTAAGTNIYKATQKYRANFLVVSPEFIEILTLCDGFKANEVKPGPYFLGTIAGLKVFVSPQLENEAYVGFNSNDLAASPAVFAPFMVCTPTMLLEMPDNAAMQGFATLYDLKPLNTALVAGITLNTTDVDPIYVAAEGE